MKAQQLFIWMILFAVLISVFQWDGLGKWMYPIHYENEIRIFAQEKQVDPYLVAAIIRVESNFKNGLTSSKGAKGVMQIMPETADWIREKNDLSFENSTEVLLIPEKNIQIGTIYIKYLMSQFPSNDALLLAAYNAGQGTVRKWIETGVWDGTYERVEQIPYAETRHYVKRVLFYRDQYQSVYQETFHPDLSKNVKFENG